jgi:hypothetical protein
VDTYGFFDSNRYLRLKRFMILLAISLGEGIKKPHSRPNRSINHVGASLMTTVSTPSVATLEVRLDWSMVSTLELGFKLTVGAILFVVPTV